MFWSDLGPKIGFEAMGLVDSKRYRTVGFFGKATKEDTPENRDAVKDSIELKNAQNDDSEKYGKGVIFYVNKKNVIVGCVTWNIFGIVEVVVLARAAIHIHITRATGPENAASATTHRTAHPGREAAHRASSQG